MKNYNVLNELVPKTQELHRAIFDKGYEQGQRDILEQQSCADTISRQEAIKLIQKYGVGCFDAEEFSPEQCERFVISKLNSLPSVAPKHQPCEDVVSKFISRQVSLIEERMSSATSEGRWVEEEKCQYAIENLELVNEYIKAHPPVTPKEKTGKWKVQHTNLSHLPSDTIVTCLECGHTKSRIDGEILNFCPNCGARMVNE